MGHQPPPPPRPNVGGRIKIPAWEDLRFPWEKSPHLLLHPVRRIKHVRRKKRIRLLEEKLGVSGYRWINGDGSAYYFTRDTGIRSIG